jgi:predicted acyl esterase
MPGWGDYGSLATNVAPMLGRALRSGQLLTPACELVEDDPDVLAEYAVRIPVSAGYELTANVFRSRSAEACGERLPVVMFAHPYDNSLIPALGRTPLGGPPQQYRVIPQQGRPRFTRTTSWEAPDTSFWVRAGYAVGT